MVEFPGPLPKASAGPANKEVFVPFTLPATLLAKFV